MATTQQHGEAVRTNSSMVSPQGLLLDKAMPPRACGFLTRLCVMCMHVCVVNGWRHKCKASKMVALG